MVDLHTKTPKKQLQHYLLKSQQVRQDIKSRASQLLKGYFPIDQSFRHLHSLKRNLDVIPELLTKEAEKDRGYSIQEAIRKASPGARRKYEMCVLPLATPPGHSHNTTKNNDFSPGSRTPERGPSPIDVERYPNDYLMPARKNYDSRHVLTRVYNSPQCRLDLRRLQGGSRKMLQRSQMEEEKAKARSTDRLRTQNGLLSPVLGRKFRKLRRLSRVAYGQLQGESADLEK